MVHIKIAFKLKVELVDALYTSNHICHNSFKYFISGCKYTSISFLGYFSPRINSVNIKLSFDIHFHGGRLYVTRTTGQQLYIELRFLKGLNPSVVRLSLKLRDSNAKHGYISSTVSHTGESTRWHIFPS
ncbi:hypothetical protein ACOSQ3_014434 [Xanthoceras sorbifolium]